MSSESFRHYKWNKTSFISENICHQRNTELNLISCQSFLLQREKFLRNISYSWFSQTCPWDISTIPTDKIWDLDKFTEISLEIHRHLVSLSQGHNKNQTHNWWDFSFNTIVLSWKHFWIETNTRWISDILLVWNWWSIFFFFSQN